MAQPDTHPCPPFLAPLREHLGTPADADHDLEC